MARRMRRFPNRVKFTALVVMVTCGALFGAALGMMVDGSTVWSAVVGLPFAVAAFMAWLVLFDHEL